MPFEAHADKEGQEVDPYVPIHIALQGKPVVPIVLAFHEVACVVIRILLVEGFFAAFVAAIGEVPPRFSDIP